MMPLLVAATTGIASLIAVAQVFPLYSVTDPVSDAVTVTTGFRTALLLAGLMELYVSVGAATSVT